MGLEVMELVLALEEDLAVSIPDRDLSFVETVGDLYEVLLRRLQLAEGPVCLTSHAFYRLRRGLMSVTGCERNAVKPASHLGDLLPTLGRRRAWAALRHASGLPLPPLQRSTTLDYALLAVALLVASRMLMILVNASQPADSAVFVTAAGLAALVGLLAWAVGRCLTLSAAWVFPGKALSVEDLVRRVTHDGTCSAYEPARPAIIDRDVVWNVLVHHSAQIGRAPENSIHAETRFYEDLHFG